MLAYFALARVYIVGRRVVSKAKAVLYVQQQWAENTV